VRQAPDPDTVAHLARRTLMRRHSQGFPPLGAGLRAGRWRIVNSQMTTIKPQRGAAGYCTSISIPPT
jgi:hypothetical protein